MSFEMDEASFKIKKLQAFKNWVHAYLDSKGIPTHPDGPHSKEGCRIGDRLDLAFARLSITDLVQQSHGTAVEKGWWEDMDRSIGEQLMLYVTEIAEAMEDWREGHPLIQIRHNEKGKPEGFGIELADVLIRIGDTCGRYGIDLEECVRVKLAYNKTRPHRHGGKKA